jgi:hypothetical protein
MEVEVLEHAAPSGLAVAGEAAEEAALAQGTPMAPAHAGATASPSFKLSEPAQQVLLHSTAPACTAESAARCLPCMQPIQRRPRHHVLCPSQQAATDLRPCQP